MQSLYMMFLILLGYGDLSVFPFLTPGTGPRGPCDEGGILTPNLEMMAKKGTYDMRFDSARIGLRISHKS